MYKRILIMHQRDMSTLEELHFGLFVTFMEGYILGQKSNHPFSKIALDQMNEQLIDLLKSSGSLGIDLLTRDPATLRRQLVVENNLTQIHNRFQNPPAPSLKHHKQYYNFQSDMKVN